MLILTEDYKYSSPLPIISKIEKFEEKNEIRNYPEE